MIDMKEVRSTLLGVAIVLAYTMLVLFSGRVDPGQYSIMFLAYVGASIGLWIAVGVIGMLVEMARQARRSGSEPFLYRFVRESIAARWRRDRGASLLWPPLLFGTLMASFNAFKQMILPLAGYRFDDAFAAADRMLFSAMTAGVSPTPCSARRPRRPRSIVSITAGLLQSLSA